PHPVRISPTVTGNKEHATPDTHGGSAPVTKQDFHNLVVEIKNLLVPDVVIIKADLQAPIDRVKASEEDISNLKHGLFSLTISVQHLQVSYFALSLHYTALDKRSRRNHLKMRGIPDAVKPEELLHYGRR
ncbi:Hypothetical predicted protein, partial [Pelobates cultripes]